MDAERTREPDFGVPARLWRPVAAALAAAVTLSAMAWSLDVPRMMGVSYYPQQFLAVILALTLPLAFMLYRPDREKRTDQALPWYDVAGAILSLTACAYIAINYATVVNFVFTRPVEAWLPGIILLVLLLEGLRRSTGWVLVVIMIVFLLYAMFGNIVPGRLAGRPQDWQKLAGYMAYDVNGVFGLSLSVGATIVVAFIFFGALLGATGGAKFFTDAALLSMGRYRGGSMKIAVVASGLFGSISGSAVANVVATGVVTIPMIKRDKYPAYKAGAIEAVASTGGQLMPPVMGAAAFLMAEFLQVPYADVALAALVPALLYYGALFIQADLEAAKLGIKSAPEDQIPSRRTIMGGLHFLIAFGLLIYALFGMNWLPERAAFLACASVVATAAVFGYDGMRASVRQLLDTIVETGESVVEIIVISAAAGIVIGVMNITGLSFNLTYALVQLGGGSAIVLLLMSAIVCIILGMGLPTLAVYVLLASLVAPALVEVGLHPMAAHLFVLYFGMMSMITPPIALASFAAASIAKADPIKTGLASCKFGWIAFVIPFMFAYSPSLLLIGETGEVAWAVLTATFGMWLVSAALAGYFASRLSTLMRIVFAVSGILSLIPAGAFPGAIYTDAVGLVVGIPAMIFAYVTGRKVVEHAIT
ncbi:TRAP transporter permease [Neorhizobium huautlense]|uniref:TRAP transporter permease n=1 Tax=Neorhizobium huautlense TaxID=67774 RepID=UPI000CF88FC6|nr:TRAP transporter fused permease subunit [Neorhizobium huautlense]